MACSWFGHAFRVIPLIYQFSPDRCRRSGGTGRVKVCLFFGEVEFFVTLLVIVLQFNFGIGAKDDIPVVV